MTNNDDNVTVEIAYAAMFKFLENIYDLTNSPDIGGLLGGMALLENGNTADPAYWDDWLDAIKQARKPECDIKFKIIKS